MKKKYLLKCALLMLFGFFFQIQARAQAGNREWTLLKEAEDVKAYYMFDECDSQAFVYLKIENSSTSGKKVSWKATNEKEGEDIILLVSSNGPILIEPGKGMSADCSNPTPELTILLKKEILISNFKLDLTVQL